jgi:hypothetical protein
MQTDHVALKKDVGELQTETAQLKTDMGALNTRVDNTNDRISALQAAFDDKLRDMEAAFLSKVQSMPVQFPALTAGQQTTINDCFETLRAQARACRNIFVLGQVPDFGQPVSLRVLLTSFFQKIEVKTLPKPPKSKVWRVSVPTDKASEMRSIMDANVFAIRDHGWWIQQDLPPKLRQMHSNAYAFVKFARDSFRRLRPTTFDVEDGYLHIENTPIVPVYLIPKKKANWKDLATVLVTEAGSLPDTEWLESVVKGSIDQTSLMSKWCTILGVEVKCGESNASSVAVNFEEAETMSDLVGG